MIGKVGGVEKRGAGLRVAYVVPRQDRGGVELPDGDAEQALLIQGGVFTVERQQIVQVQGRLRLVQEQVVGPARGEVGVPPRHVGADLVEENVDADRGQVRLIVRPHIGHGGPADTGGGEGPRSTAVAGSRKRWRWPEDCSFVLNNNGKGLRQR